MNWRTEKTKTTTTYGPGTAPAPSTVAEALALLRSSREDIAELTDRVASLSRSVFWLAVAFALLAISTVMFVADFQ